MANFTYVATDASGNRITGQIEATDRSAALQLLTNQNLRASIIRETKQKTAGLSFLKGRVKSDDIVVFTRQLSAMISAGVPLLRALTSLQTHMESPALKEILTGICADVESGAALADALEKHPDTFSSVYINMVRAGETAGILDDILKRLATQQEKNATMRKKIKSAMTYPMVLVVITILAFFGLMLFVIPQIGKIIKDLGGPDAELPMLTQVMLNISAAMISYWWIVFPVLGAAVYAFLRFLKTPAGKYIFHRFSLKVPGVGQIITKVAVARFSRTFSALIGAGVPVLEALDVTARAVGNALFEEALLDASQRVKEGAQLSAVIETNALFPAIVPQMLAVGEETGQTDTVLVKVADFYEEEVDVAIDGLSSIIEPIMIVFMGSMVGAIAASVMMPIANMSNTIKG